jgi:hypothetical protein
MAVVIGILQAADRRLRSTHTPRQFLLREANLHSKLADLSCDLRIDDFLFVILFVLGIARDVAAVQELRCL